MRKHRLHEQHSGVRSAGKTATKQSPPSPIASSSSCRVKSLRFNDVWGIEVVKHVPLLLFRIRNLPGLICQECARSVPCTSYPPTPLRARGKGPKVGSEPQIYWRESIFDEGLAAHRIFMNPGGG